MYTTFSESILSLEFSCIELYYKTPTGIWWRSKIRKRIVMSSLWKKNTLYLIYQLYIKLGLRWSLIYNLLKCRPIPKLELNSKGRKSHPRWIKNVEVLSQDLNEKKTLSCISALTIVIILQKEKIKTWTSTGITTQPTLFVATFAKNISRPNKHGLTISIRI